MNLKPNLSRLAVLRRKRVLVPTVAAVAVLAVGGTVWSAAGDDHVGGDERDRVAAAAVAAVGDGTAGEVETSDDRGAAYEVEVRLPDGSEVDVTLNEDLAVVEQDQDDRDRDGDDRDRDDRDRDWDDRDDTDDRALEAAERSAAEKAALAEVGGGTVIDVEASDDAGVSYDVEVRDSENVEWDVHLDAAFGVVAKSVDN